MKGKHLALLLLLVALIGGAGYYLQKDNNASWSPTKSPSGGKVLDFPINDVARVTIKSAEGELNLVKKDDEWTVQERADYPAAFEQVSDLIRKLWELKTVQEVKVGPSQFARLELVEPGKEGTTGTVMELKGKDGKNLAALLIGKTYQRKGDGMPGESGGFPAGRYVVPVGSPKVSLVSETLESVAAKPEQWLKRDFFKIDNVKSIQLEGASEAQHWAIGRENAAAEWTLANAKADEKLDAGKVSPLATLFANAAFADVLPPDAKADETGLDKPTTVTIETFDKFTYTLKIGKPTGENQPVLFTVKVDLPKDREPGKDEKPEDKAQMDQEFQAVQRRFAEKLAAEKKFEPRPYLIAKSTLDPLLKDRAALLVEKKPEPAAGHPETPKPTSAFTPPISITTPTVSAPPAPPPAQP